MGAADILGGTGASSAAERLGGEREPTGKLGSPFLTVKVRNEFTQWRAENPDSDLQWEEWLEQQGYGLGDNEHVYKKEE